VRVGGVWVNPGDLLHGDATASRRFRESGVGRRGCVGFMGQKPCADYLKAAT